MKPVLQVLIAVAEADGSADLTQVALSATGWSGGRELIAGLIAQDLLDGEVEEDTFHTRLLLAVHGITSAGRQRLVAELSESIPTSALSIARALVTRAPISIEGLASDLSLPRDSVRQGVTVLLEGGLIAHDPDLCLTVVGRSVLDAIDRPSTSNNTVIHGDIVNSMVAGAGSAVSGSITIGISDSDRAALVSAVAELLMRLDEMELASDQLAELRADLESLRLQCSSPRAKRAVIEALLDNVKGILQGVGGNAVFAWLGDLVRRLHL